MKAVTLKEIAQKAGASVATVHRVLNNKEGVGEELREKILQISKDLGYSVNYVASSLKKKTTHFVAIFPQHNHESKYYTKYLLDGYKQRKEELSNFNIHFDEYYFEINENALIELLTTLFEEQIDKIDGLLLPPINSDKIKNMINRFCDRGVPVILFEKDIPETDRLSCIKPNDEVAGNLAGELLSKYIKQNGKVIIADGDITVVNDYLKVDSLNGSSCEKTLVEMSNGIEFEKIYETNENNKLYNKVLHLLKTEENIVGIYSTTARNTVPIAKVINDLGLKNNIQFIGSEVFEENIEMLNKGVIDTIIYKNPYKIGYEALNTLFNYVIKNETPKHEYKIDPMIILKSNLETLNLPV